MKWKLTYFVGSKAVESWVLNSQSLAYWKKQDLLATRYMYLKKMQVILVCLWHSRF